MKTNIKKITYTAAGLTLAASMILISSASAESDDNKTQPVQGRVNSSYNRSNEDNVRPGMKPGIVGKVTAVNGNTITVLSIQRGPMKKPTSGNKPSPAQITYTVDATNAIIKKNSATSTVSNILVGDMIMVQGTVNGTNVVAVNIRDNEKDNDGNEWGKEGRSTSTPAFVGNGQPIIAGKLITINGNTLTVTTATNLTYTVDATNAKILNGQATSTVAGLKIGDSILVQGAVSGSSVTASTVINKTVMPININPEKDGGKGNGGGIFGGIGRFFMSIFGF
jgi:hypothetical protein